MASEEPASALFDPSLKKKKKKVTLDLDAELGLDSAPAAGESSATGAAGATAADTEEGGANEGGADGNTGDDELAAMFGGMKKKKKKPVSTKRFTVDLENIPKPKSEAAAAAAAKEETAAPAAAAAAPAAEGGAEDDLNFGELKKKKKSSKSKKLEEFEKELAAAEGGEGAAEGAEEDEDDEDGPAPGEDGPDRTAEGDLGDDVFAGGDDEGADGAAGKASAVAAAYSGDDATAAWRNSDRDYSYTELLGRIFSTLRQHNPTLGGDKKKYTIVPPVVQREGSKKTMFANSLDICKRMHREPEHVYSFLFAELGTLGNVDGSQRLVIKGRFQPKQIENVLRKYIVEYVTCKTCKSPNTVLSKRDRIYFMTCSTCGSSRSVSAIKTGFQAITGKRSKLRAA